MVGIARNYQNKEVYIVSGNNARRILNVGVDAEALTTNVGLGTLVNTNDYTLFQHTSNVLNFAISFGGTTVYCATADNEIRSVGTDGLGDQLIFTTVGPVGTLAPDPWDANTLVYIDGSDLKYRNLATTVTTDVIVGDMNGSNYLAVLDGVVHTALYFKTNKGFIITRLDGTDVFEYLPEMTATFTLNYMLTSGLIVDSVNKKVYILSTTDNLFWTIIDANIADLPPDPSVFSVTPRPISLDVMWPATSGGTAYGVNYSVGAVGAQTEITSVTNTTNLNHSVRNLLPNTQYSVFLYYSTNSAAPSILIGSNAYTTLPNIAGNHDSSAYDDGSGGFDLSDLNSDSLETLEEVMNELFDSWDILSLP